MTWQEAWQAALQGLRRTWQTSRAHSITMAATAIIVAMIPAGLALLSGAIVSDVETLLQSDEPAFSAVLPWLLLTAGLLTAIGLGQVARRYSEERLGDEMSVLINREVIEHAASLGPRLLRAEGEPRHPEPGVALPGTRVPALRRVDLREHHVDHPVLLGCWASCCGSRPSSPSRWPP